MATQRFRNFLNTNCNLIAVQQKKGTSTSLAPRLFCYIKNQEPLEWISFAKFHFSRNHRN